MITQTNGNHPSTPPADAAAGAALYVDTENLREGDRAQEAIAQAVASWPGPLPLGSLSLYVRADKVAVWEMWAEESYPDLRVRVRGVQHFSNNRAKNSADIAITADAVADLVTGQAAAVAVVSNDSDFGALFVKVRELALDAGLERTPFLWITSDDAGMLSPEMERFIPDGLRWDLSADESEPEAVESAPAPATTPVASQPVPPQPLPAAARPAVAQPMPARPAAAAVRPAAGPNPGNDAIAVELIRRLSVGKFKVTDAHDVFKELWPRHSAAAGPAQFGTFLLKEVWPILQKRGVLMTRKSSPRTYEITPAAKESIARTAGVKPSPSPPPAQPPRRSPPVPEPAPAQIAAAVAAAINDDIFSATEALDAIKSNWPAHPAAGMTPQRFGVWFSEQLWPVMQRHGVTLYKEKPRRYEITPDARHRLTSISIS